MEVRVGRLKQLTAKISIDLSLVSNSIKELQMRKSTAAKQISSGDGNL
ncbi:hypothetical protein BH10CYA1_BH10CYA1_18000 [soil metagenome]